MDCFDDTDWGEGGEECLNCLKTYKGIQYFSSSQQEGHQGFANMRIKYAVHLSSELHSKYFGLQWGLSLCYI